MEKLKSNLCIAMTGLCLVMHGGVKAESLYNERTFHSLVADAKAYRVGDLLTVQITENATASSSTDFGSSRKNDVGLKADVDGALKHGLGLQTDNGFDSKGRTQRSGRLLAQITVSVQEVRRNGDLVVSGKQLLNINDEKQEIQLTGVVRPRDIEDNNTVLSTRLGEANISYAGEGELASRQRPSWWSRLLAFIGW
ncbi:flagellar L-ring protein precursor FlgH [Chitinivorax tropicus]|uniref:Flagellar L-ring protein FlgH n=1 Tax=Chitinivorax tropicus TaxID=714531 RepID=A0A840MU39_9PROT|nr:flagellar basal body L-ring protein FlgH [Chitinivorax tropicus]MBB5020312.1 flagellar L-ring protein precursor FlgH [Chitinivorax tropicus]